MVVAAVDDLMFVSKISAAARQLGVNVRFVRTAEDVRAAVSERPTLVIFDLNSRTTDPLAAIAALKADRSSSGVRTIGFVSHVQGDVVRAARQAGVDEVLARSAFVERLREILSRDREQ